MNVTTVGGPGRQKGSAMKYPQRTRRGALLLAACVLLLAIPAAASAATTSAAAGSGTGWIQLAHLSPNTPAMDVYLYPYGNPDARIVLHRVSYGNVSSFQAVPEGDYSIAMRPAGDPAGSSPVLSASTWIRAGRAYTAAAVGPRSGLRLAIFGDDLTTPPGKALVRVIQASLKQPQVTVSWNGKLIAGKLRFSSVTAYEAVQPGTQDVAVTANGGGVASAVTVTDGSIHTLVVLDGAKGLELANLVEAAGSSQLPRGGAATGYGGTASREPGSPLPWRAAIAAGSVLAVAGGLGLRRSRRGPALQTRARDIPAVSSQGGGGVAEIPGER